MTTRPTLATMVAEAQAAGRPTPPLVFNYYDGDKPRKYFRDSDEEYRYFAQFLNQRVLAGTRCELCGDTYRAGDLLQDFCRCRKCNGLRTAEIAAEFDALVRRAA